MVRKTMSLLVLSLGLFGCETTGDPTKGGLIGWDENKAKLRQESLKRQHLQRQKRLQELNALNDELDDERRKSKSDLDLLRQEFERLTFKATRLLATITDLNKKNHLSENQVEKLIEQYNKLTIVNEPGPFDGLVEVERRQLLERSMREVRALEEEVELMLRF